MSLRTRPKTKKREGHSRRSNIKCKVRGKGDNHQKNAVCGIENGTKEGSLRGGERPSMTCSERKLLWAGECGSLITLKTNSQGRPCKEQLQKQLTSWKSVHLPEESKERDLSSVLLLTVREPKMFLNLTPRRSAGDSNSIDDSLVPKSVEQLGATMKRHRSRRGTYYRQRTGERTQVMKGAKRSWGSVLMEGFI